MKDLLSLSNIITSLLVLVLVYINIKLFRKKKMVLPVLLIMEIGVFAQSQRVSDALVIILCIIGGLLLKGNKIKFGDDDDFSDDGDGGHHHGGDDFGGDGGGGHH